MVAAFGIVLAFLASGVQISAFPVLERRAGISTLASAQVASYKRYTYFASAAYCMPANTLAWNCGTTCSANPGFKPIASGGDGATVQYWYVGYDPTSTSVVVAYQGTDPSKIQSLVTDIDFFLDKLDPTLFPGVSNSIKTHSGFGKAHAKSANAVLAAVKKSFSTYHTNKVTVVGHSLGAALAIISTGHLSVNLPSTTKIRTISYSSPRVGNKEFANWVNARADMVRIDNKHDLIPIVPGLDVGFAHTEGEIHIVDSNAWMSCPGQDNTNSQCTIGYVPNIFEGTLDDHSGPFDGITMGC